MVSPVEFLQSLGLPQILLWLLTFAIMHGILEQVKTPASKMARGIISIVVSFLVIMSAPAALISLISQMSASLVLVILGILVLVVFFEVAGVRSKVITEWKKNEKTGQMEPSGAKEISIFERYGYLFAIAFLIIVLLIFVSAGGLELLGFTAPAFDISSPGTMTIFFFIAIIIAIVWMISNPE